jgi:hypothetical protein
LIHEHGADGYLLVCRRDVSSKVREMFKGLKDNCRFSYNYEIWTGNEFKDKILLHEKLIQKYFPEYWVFTQKVKDKTILEDL